MSFSSNETTDLNSMKDHKESREDLVLAVDITSFEFNRIKTFYGSKLSEPLICECTVSVFTSFDMTNNSCPSIDPDSNLHWSQQAQGALVLQKMHDRELLDDYCGARLIVTSVNTCDLLWSISLYSWNEYQCINENFHKFSKWSRDSIIEDEIIDEDYCVGIHFPNGKAAAKFYQFVNDYIEQMIFCESRSCLEKKRAVKESRSSISKKSPIKKSMISAPIMFTHTLHLDKAS